MTDEAQQADLETLAARSDDVRLAALSVLGFGALVAALWCIFYAVWAELPYVRAGHAIIYQAKLRVERQGSIFPRAAAENILIFGNSKVLSGFVPAIFDSLCHTRSGRRANSYNMGLPDADHFVSDLELLATRGEIPSQILLTIPWTTDTQNTIFSYLHHDRQILEQLFPFRTFPRDLILFGVRSTTRGGPGRLYEQGRAIAARMELDRGYYFIESQSHYAAGHLPVDFHLESDDLHGVEKRAANTGDAEFVRLARLADRYSLQIHFVPSYFRVGEYAAPAAINVSLERALAAHPRFHVWGPDYWLLPNRYFSDPVHLNPDGAELYSRKLALLLSGGAGAAL